MKAYIRIIIYSAIAVIAIASAFYLFKHISSRGGVSATNKALLLQNTALSKTADELESKGDFIAAKQVYQKFLYDHPDAANTDGLQNKIYALNIKILFSPVSTENSQVYTVASGDSLEKIAKKFSTTVELIKKANGLSSNTIRPNLKLKVQNKPFSIAVDKSQNTLTLICEGEVIKVYRVSTGKDNCTPVGKFTIVNKLIDPPWYSAKGVISSDSPENVLGTRWMGIDRPGYGIHGTIDPSSIGSQKTEGCVRMYNSEVEELYSIVPQGTEVTIID